MMRNDMFKKVMIVIGFAAGLLITASSTAPYLTIGSEAHAGVKECKSRCQEKFMHCKKPSGECRDDQRECEKDCEANAK